MKAQNTLVWIVAAMVCATPAAFARSTAQAKKDNKKPQEATASKAAQAPAAAPGSEKLDVSDLENKYWAPKDTDFSVVQNRTYAKEKKVFVSLQYGPDLASPYLAGNHLGATVNYFKNERYGFQATYMKSYLRSNRALGDLASLAGGLQPDHGRMESYYGVGFNWVPFYSKMSFLGKKILYFDMAITPTLGMTQYDQLMDNGSRRQNALTYGLDITQYYFFSDHWAIRADLKNQWRQEKIIGYSNAKRGQDIRSQSDRDMMFLLGVSFYFGK